MQIRSEDVRAIVSAVEWLVDGSLSEFRLKRGGQTIFAARLQGDALQIDPEVMPATLAQRLLDETDLLGTDSSTNGGPSASGPPKQQTRNQQSAPAEARV